MVAVGFFLQLALDYRSHAINHPRPERRRRARVAKPSILQRSSRGSSVEVSSPGLTFSIPSRSTTAKSSLDSVFLNPRIAGVVASGYKRMFSLMVEEFERLFKGHETLFDLTPRTMANRRAIEPEG